MHLTPDARSAPGCASRRAQTGLTLIEVLTATALTSLAAMMLYGSLRLANAMIHSSRQRLEAGALAMDQIMAVFNTWDFKNTLLATNLPPAAPPSGSFLPSNSEIRTMIAPAPGALPPCQWEVEVRVVWDQARAGVIRAPRADDTVLRVTRYDIERN